MAVFIIYLFLIIFSLIFLFILFSLMLISLRNSILKEAPFVPSSQKEIEKMIEIADLKEKNLIVYDLGCGDGRLIIKIAKKYNLKAIGIEKSFILFLLAKIKNFFSHSGAKIINADIKDIDLSKADVIFCYLWPEQMKKLKKKFEKELKNGARIISLSFPINNWRPEKTLKVNSKTIYLYKYSSSHT